MNSSSMIIGSTILLSLAFLFLWKTRFSKKVFFCFTTISFIVLILNILFLVSDYFTGRGITEGTLYTLSYGLEGMSLFAYKEIIIVISIFSLGTLVFLITFWKLWRKRGPQGEPSYIVSTLFLLLAFILSPGTKDFYRLFVSNLFTKDSGDFHLYYQQPVLNQVGEKRNLVFIYAEGLEQTYSKENIFPELTPHLNKLEEQSLFFTHLKQTYGANYTMGGMVASQCGIPIVGPEYGNSMSGMDTYLPQAVCLGDLLHNEGYYLSYYGGARASFAGKDLFYKTHHFDEVKGFEDFPSTSLNPSYVSEWGAYDDTLFDASYNRFIELSKNDKPFGLFLLTLDTHQPKGKMSESCRKLSFDGYYDPMLKNVKCSDFLISRFVNKILASPYMKNTVVVVASDHLSPTDPTRTLSDGIERNNRLMIFSPQILRKEESEVPGSTLDTGSTLLPFLGFEGEIGLGRNLRNQNLPISELQFIQKKITSWRNDLSQFWSYPVFTDSMVIDPERERVIMNKREFKIPVLITFDSDFKTTLSFQFDLEYDTSDKRFERDLISQVQRISDQKTFLLIDLCNNIQKLKKEAGNKGYCILTRKKGEGFTAFPQENLQKYSRNELISLIGMEKR